MKYTVCWNVIPEQDLIVRWIEASTDDRSRITAAVSTIEKALRERPFDVGFEHKEGLRTVIARPVALEYVVHEDDRMVNVLTIFFE